MNWNIKGNERKLEKITFPLRVKSISVVSILSERFFKVNEEYFCHLAMIFKKI